MKSLDPRLRIKAARRRSQRTIDRSIDRCRVFEWVPELLVERQGDRAMIRATVRPLVRHIHDAHPFAVDTAYTPVK